MAPSKKRPKSSSRKVGFVLGRARFEKISEVEGIKTTDEMRRMFEEFDRKGLSNEERRAAIQRRFKKAPTPQSR